MLPPHQILHGKCHIPIIHVHDMNTTPMAIYMYMYMYRPIHYSIQNISNVNFSDYTGQGEKCFPKPQLTGLCVLYIIQCSFVHVFY